VSSYLRVLRHPNFRFLFLGQAASAIGDGVVLVAIALYVTQSTGSASDLGLVLAAQTLPLVTLLLFGGVWADRLPRQRIMIATDLVRAALHGLLAVLILSGAVAIWQLVVIEACYGAAQAFFQPAYSGLVPQTVPEGLILEARGITEWMANLATLLGPALATALVLGIGAGEAFAFDAATFILSALLLTRVHPRPRGRPASAAPLARALREGWREVRSRAWVWVTIASFSGAVLCMYAQWYALAPGIARHVYGSAGVFGVIETLAGLGAVCGALVSLRWRPEHPLAAGLVLTLAWPLQCALFALSAPVGLVSACGFATGFGFALLMIWWETALAQHIPAHVLSRVSAYDWMGSLALLPLGYALAGPLAGALGAQVVLGIGSVAGLALLLLALAPRSTRRLRSVPGGPVEVSVEPRVAQLAAGVEP
jgi:MFS family permease